MKQVGITITEESKVGDAAALLTEYNFPFKQAGNSFLVPMKELPQALVFLTARKIPYTHTLDFGSLFR